MLSRLCILLSAALFFLTAVVQADVDPIVIKVGYFFLGKRPTTDSC
jgi:hypothetical protein